MPPSLIDLPPETLLAIAGYLDSTTDYIHLSRSHRSIAHRLHDRTVLAKTIQRVAGYSKEWALVTSNRMSPIDALLCVYGRRQALSEARPASTLVLGDGQSFLYQQGLLAYVRDDLIRILHVHNARRTEGVIYISLIGSRLLGVECKDSKVELLHLQDGMLTFIYRGETSTFGWASWILVIDIAQSVRLSLAVDPWTSEDVVVRNNRQYVCIIAPTGSSANGRHREWVCRVWNIDSLPARPATLQIPELTINEVGQALVFEVYDGFLYAISTQSSRQMEEPEWVSHYTCFRFPLSSPDRSTLESIRIWRRHHREGPINDLWTDLQLVRDESTGELTIIEARKEWTEGSSTQRRTWYRQRLPAVFSDPSDTDDKDQNMMDSNDQDNSALAVSQLEVSSSSSNMTDSPYLFKVPPDGNETGHYRLSRNTHAEYSPSVCSTSVVGNSNLAKNKYRTYISSAAAFIDLIVDDRQASSHTTAWAQHLRLRIGSRKEASPLDEHGILHRHSVYPHSRQAIEGSELRYEDKGIRLWPPADAPIVLQDLLNGSTSFRASGDANESKFKSPGDITAVADERSMVYLVKGKDAAENDKGKLILINFDQYIQFWHNTWVPDFIDLYGHEQDLTDVVPEPKAQVLTKRIHDSIEMDIDKSEDSGTDSGHDRSDDGGECEEETTLQPADEVNDLFWCEEFDDDEPVNLHWYQEQMALWTDFREGFCFT
ncbi:MAG: hypothetical protein L6R38_000606 [Xanthoria sp. 2 TBL-2021]|nr:MAG: hypothetical protein L6R38_000606 [Xanthoria sp. 2 TBL-2021]